MPRWWSRVHYRGHEGGGLGHGIHIRAREATGGVVVLSSTCGLASMGSSSPCWGCGLGASGAQSRQRQNSKQQQKQ
jgi:hypothetical protein